jgi:anthranilate phosphoribosyltransferase
VTLRGLGLRRASTEQLTGGSAADNAALVEAVLGGASGPRRDVVLLNAGAALEVAGRAAGLAAGVELAGAAIDSGRASGLLDRLRARRARQAEAATGADAGASTPATATPTPA